MTNKDHAGPSLPLRHKRCETLLPDQKTPFSYNDYTIAWICTLQLEMVTAVAMLDARHEKLEMVTNDGNMYELGNIQGHNIVIVCLPWHETTYAANVLADMRRTFTSIKMGLIVGIGGGAPNNADIRLGDVVVGTRVMPYHVESVSEDEKTALNVAAVLPARNITSAVSTLRAKQELKLSRMADILRQVTMEYPDYGLPNAPDRLFQAESYHEPEIDCEGCDPSKIKQRKARSTSGPVIHYGGIASGNCAMKHGFIKDKVSKKLDVMCFEMKVASLMDVLDCLLIRGICDYSDAHKSLAWQKYAAATSAAYARDLLEALPVVEEAKNFANTKLDRRTPLLQNRTRELLDSLKFQQIDSRRNNIKSPHANTCHWFLELPEYRSWLDHEKAEKHSCVLWIRGQSGVGKSTMMKFIYSTTKKNHPEAITAAFFFNARGSPIEKSVYGMYRSILLQLLEGLPDLQTALDPELIPHNQINCPSLQILKNLFANAISALGQRSFICFIDALDECDEQYAMDMIQYFEELAETCTKDKIKFRICLSSRHYPYINIRLGLRLILEDQPGHVDDLNSYITDHLQAGDSGTIEELRLHMVAKSAGVFLWVVLVTGMLNREIQRDYLALRRRLEGLPSTLGELFKGILTRNNEKNDDAFLCFLWILFAKRPLTPKELHHAVWAGWQLKDEANRDIPRATGPDAVECFNSLVTTWSKGLAEITDTWSPTVQFIHESIPEFLIRDGGLSELCPSAELDWESLGHEMLKRCCSVYIKSPSVRESIENLKSGSQSPSASNALSRKYPFLRYATRQLLYHANCAASRVAQDEFLSQFAVDDWISAVSLLDKLPTRAYSPTASLLYILAEMGLPSLISIRLKYDPDIHILGERYRYPVFAALANGHKEAVAALLNLPTTVYNGIDIVEGFQRRTDFKDYQGQTPLSWAVRGGRREFAKLLLLKSTHLDEIVDGEGHTPLTWAIANDQKDMAILLIEAGANIGACNMDQMTPLMLALQHDNLDVARHLVEKGADVNAICCTPPTTPLLYALEKGFQSIAMLLIEKGANIEASLDNRNALMIALKSGLQAVVNLFIDNGAEVNTRGTDGSRPLHLAARENNQDIVKRLIEKGADVNSRDENGSTPLHLASEESFEFVVQLLVDNGADVNAQDVHGSTPLHLASLSKLSIKDRRGSHLREKQGPMPPYVALRASWEAAPKFLIENGADVNARDEEGAAPLHLALKASCKIVARLLIKNGADVNARTKEGIMPLHIALRESCETLSRLLIENGANINTRDEEGFMPLHVALYRSYTAVARLLISQRVDIGCLDKHGSTSLHLALENWDEGTATLLIDNGAKVNVCNAEGATPLHIALEKGYETLSMLLIHKKADVNAYDKDRWTPLHLALIKGWELVSRLLIDKGADVNSCTAAGLTPLHLVSNCEVMAKVLIDKGANINAFDKEHRTPLYIALDCKEMIRILFRKGGTVSILDVYNQTNVYLALRKSSKAVAALLFRLGAQNGSFACIGI